MSLSNAEFVDVHLVLEGPGARTFRISGHSMFREMGRESGRQFEGIRGEIDKTPADRVTELTARMTDLKSEIDAMHNGVPEGKSESEKELDLTKRLTDITRQLGAARAEVDRKGEAAADEALRKLHDRQKLEETFQETVDREREKIMSEHRRPNQGAGILGRNAHGDDTHHLEKEQLSVLKHIEQLLARNRGGSPAVDMGGRPGGYAF